MIAVVLVVIAVGIFLLQIFISSSKRKEAEEELTPFSSISLKPRTRKTPLSAGEAGKWVVCSLISALALFFLLMFPGRETFLVFITSLFASFLMMNVIPAFHLTSLYFLIISMFFLPWYFSLFFATVLVIMYLNLLHPH